LERTRRTVAGADAGGTVTGTNCGVASAAGRGGARGSWATTRDEAAPPLRPQGRAKPVHGAATTRSAGGGDAPHSGARLRCCRRGVRRRWRGRRGPQHEHRGGTAAEHRRRWGCGRRRRSRAGGEAELRRPQVRASGGEAGEGAHHRRGCRLVRAGLVIDRRTEERGWSDGSGHGRQNAGLGHYGRTMPEFGRSSSRRHGASFGSCRLLKLTLMAARRGAAGRLHTGGGAFDVAGTPSSYDSRKARPRSRGAVGAGRSDGTHRVGAASGRRDRGGAGWSGGPVDGRLCACGRAAAGRDGEIGEGDEKNLKNTDIMGPLALELNVKVTLLDGWSTHALYS
jgi:hypothetical protein